MTEQPTPPHPSLGFPGSPVRLAVLQRVCTGYRLALFRKLSAIPGLHVRLFLGEDIPNSKVRSASDLSGIDSVKLSTRLIRLGARVLPWHKGLIRELEEFHPDVVLCEGESHFLGLMQALWYRRRHRNVALIHWGGGELPGVPVRPHSIKSRFKYFVQKRFDAFLVYSSFCKECLIELGHAPGKIAVATNVSDTNSHLEKAAVLQDSPCQARIKLGLPDRFTVLYAGEMDRNKRPDLLLDLAKTTDPEQYNYVLLGDGAMLEPLRSRARAEGLHNVFLPGRVSDELPLYYRASDVMVLPGRGGMVFSEAMAWSLPVIVHQADGTEYDLVRHGETGFHLTEGKKGDFLEALETMRSAPDSARQWGANGCKLLTQHFGMDHMIVQMCHIVSLVRGGL